MAPTAHPRVLLALLAAVIVVGIGVTRSSAQAERLVLAFYYPWYGMDVWSDPALSDVPETPYNGSDPEVIARHVRWAQAAGIDVLVSGWFGPVGENITETTLRQLLNTVRPDQMAVAALFETDAVDFFPTLQSQQEALAYLLNTHARHPAYFRYRDRPVVVVWRPRTIWIDGRQDNRDDGPAVQAWREILDAVDPAREAMWIAESENGVYLDVFDGLVSYNIAAAADPAVRNAANARVVRDYNARHGTQKVWIATAMPGYDDMGQLDRANRFARDREGGAYYRRSFEGAAATNPDMIAISSFNEWVEGHQIEPSVTYGSLYLDLTRELSNLWKGR